jgi:hypothetical protein
VQKSKWHSLKIITNKPNIECLVKKVKQNRIASIQATPLCEILEPVEDADEASHRDSIEERLRVILLT